MNTCSVKSVGAWRLVRSPGSFPFPFLFMLLLVFYPNTVIKRMDFDEFANFCTLRQKKCTESQSKQWYKQIRKKKPKQVQSAPKTVDKNLHKNR